MKSLTVDDLYRQCDTRLFTFKTTDELPPFEGTIGRDRALRSKDGE